MSDTETRPETRSAARAAERARRSARPTFVAPRRSPFSRRETPPGPRATFSQLLPFLFEHRPVLRSAGYRLSTFMRACAAQYSFYLQPQPLPAMECV